MAAQLILGLSILVGLHELGHLLAAKAFGMRVEKYYIGFPPKIFGFKYGETEYALGALPLGGFVKISGMVDESLDTENLNATPEPWEFRAKPAWQRLIVMCILMAKRITRQRKLTNTELGLAKWARSWVCNKTTRLLR